MEEMSHENCIVASDGIVELDEDPSRTIATEEENENVVAALRGNALLPIARLPNEVLEKIFTLCLDPWTPFGTPTLTLSRRPLWMRLTYVCHRWRQVALCYSQLWTRISENLAKGLVPLFIDRASHRPMHISVELRDRDNRQDLIISISHRIRSLEIIGSPSPVENVIGCLIGRIPSLEQLWIGGHRYPSGNHALLPVMLFETSPRLHQLILGNGCRIEDTGDALPSLDHLTLTGGTTPVTICHLLRRTPELRTADIQEIGDTPQSDVGIEPLTLPHLQVLLTSFRDHGPLCMDTLFDNLHLPSLVCLHVHVPRRLVTIDSKGLDGVINALKGTVHRFNGVVYPISSFILDSPPRIPGRKTLRCYAWKESRGSTEFPPNPLPSPIDPQEFPAYLSYDWATDAVSPLNFFWRLSKHLSLDDVKIFTLRYHTFSRSHGCSEWSQCLSAFRSVETFVMHDCNAMIDLLVALSPPAGENVVSSGKSLFPFLKTLVITSRPIEDSEIYRSHVLELLLEAREAANIPLECVDFRGCDRVSTSLNNRLYGKVKVTWDGVEIVPDGHLVGEPKEDNSEAPSHFTLQR